MGKAPRRLPFFRNFYAAKLLQIHVLIRFMQGGHSEVRGQHDEQNRTLLQELFAK